MKKSIVLLAIWGLLNLIGYAQVPDKLNYQAVLRDNAGEIISNQNVDIEVSIIDALTAGNVLYSEEHSVSTNSYGIVNLMIGEGSNVQGDFSDLNWAISNKFINVKIDVGNGYVDMGTVQLISVPYSFYADLSDSSAISNTAYLANESYYSDSSAVSGIAHSANSAFYSDSSHVSKMAHTANSATFSDSSAISNMSYLANESYYSDSSAVSGMAHSANNAFFSDSSDVSRMAYSANASIFSDSAGVAGMAYSANTSNFADSASVAAVAHNSYTADFATNADLANTLSSGVYTTNTDTLFVVKDHNGNVVFAVFPDGAQVIVNEAAKGKVGGFAVSGRNPAKAIDTDILRITQDSTRIYVSDTVSNKGKVGGFAVSGRNPAKGTLTSYMQVTPDSTRIFVKDSVAGFGVANIEGGSSESFLNLNKQNYLIGHQTGSNTTGIYNSMIGYQAGYTNTSGSNNIFFGYKAGYLNQTGGNNVFIGTESGYVNQFTFQNTYVGYRSGYDLSGSGNTVMGSMAGENAGGGNNTFIGTSAGRIATGGNNTFLGNGAGYSFPNENTGIRNTYIGQAVGSFTNTGSYNVMLGFNAGYLNYEGSRNTFLGYNTGRNIHEGSGNVFIGHEAGNYADGINNRLIIDNENIDSTDVLFYGEFDQNHLRINGNVGINYQAYNSYGLIVDIPDGQSSIYTLLIYGDAWSSGGSWNSSDVRYKKNITTYENALNTIMQFRGVSYDWRVNEFPQQRFTEKRQLGFIAQEVEKVAPELVKEGPDGFKGLEYNKFTPIIIEAIKEQQNQIEELKKENRELKERLKKLEGILLQ